MWNASKEGNLLGRRKPPYRRLRHEGGVAVQLILEKANIDEYLKATDIIDYNDDQIMKVAIFVSQGANNEIELVHRLYEFVRDKIR